MVPVEQRSQHWGASGDGKLGAVVQFAHVEIDASLVDVAQVLKEVLDIVFVLGRHQAKGLTTARHASFQNGLQKTMGRDLKFSLLISNLLKECYAKKIK